MLQTIWYCTIWYHVVENYIIFVYDRELWGMFKQLLLQTQRLLPFLILTVLAFSNPKRTPHCHWHAPRIVPNVFYPRLSRSLQNRQAYCSRHGYGLVMALGLAPLENGTCWEYGWKWWSEKTWTGHRRTKDGDKVDYSQNWCRWSDCCSYKMRNCMKYQL